MAKAKARQARKFASNVVKQTTLQQNAGALPQRARAKAKAEKAKAKAKAKMAKKDLAAKETARVKVKKMFVVSHVGNSDISRPTAR